MIDGDVESNPGPAHGTPKGRKLKKKQFNFTPKKLDMHNVDMNTKTSVNSVTIQGNENDNDQNRPIGLVNIANDCFFNSVVQTLFALPSFRNHVRNFETHIPEEESAVHSIKELFRYIEAKSTNLLQTHNHLMSLGLPNHIEHQQSDAEECMTFIINLFYPRVNEPGNPRHNFIPESLLDPILVIVLSFIY